MPSDRGRNPVTPGAQSGGYPAFSPAGLGSDPKGAEDDWATPATYIDDLDGELGDYITDLSLWCHREISTANRRLGLLAIVTQLRERNLILPLAQLDVFARYQTILDNQIYKALRALREAQE